MGTTKHMYNTSACPRRAPQAPLTSHSRNIDKFNKMTGNQMYTININIVLCVYNIFILYCYTMYVFKYYSLDTARLYMALI